MQNRMLQVLCFQVQTTNMCLELSSIEKILPLVWVDRVPNSPAYWVGLMNISGESIPLIDLIVLLNKERTTSYSLDTPIILMTDGTHKIGMVVDNIIGNKTLNCSSLQLTDSLTRQNPFFKSTITLNNELYLFLEAKEVFDATLKKNLIKDY